jgi:hypothetical protein
MRPLLAHQGGWDEMLVAAGLVLAVMGMARLRRRRDVRKGSAPPAATSASDRCPYCGEALPEQAARCPSCGFRIAGRD